MKFTAHLFFIIIIFIASCQKDEFIYNYPETDNLLVSITRMYRDREYLSDFKYDNLNRINEILEFQEGKQIRQESFVYHKQGRLIEKNIGAYKFSTSIIRKTN